MIGFNTLTKMRLSRGGAMTAQCPGDNGTQFQSPAARKPSLSDCRRQCEVIMASARSPHNWRGFESAVAGLRVYISYESSRNVRILQITRGRAPCAR